MERQRRACGQSHGEERKRTREEAEQRGRKRMREEDMRERDDEREE